MQRNKMKLSEHDKLIALAHLHAGKSPRQVEELCSNISYAQALRLRKELDEAIRTNSLSEIFNLGEAALENLLSRVQEDLEDPVRELTGDVISLKEEMNN